MKSEMSQIFHQYLEYNAKRNFKGLKKITSPRLSGFGTGKDENTLGDFSFEDLYNREFEQIPKDLIFDIHTEHYQELSSECFIALAILDITGEIDNTQHTLFQNRITCVFHTSPHGKEGQKEWKLHHMHLSAPLDIQEEGESAPIQELRNQNIKLKQELNTLKGLIPLCASCKKFRNDAGYWQSIEEYLKTHTDVKFTHGLCEECIETLYPGI